MWPHWIVLHTESSCCKVCFPGLSAREQNRRKRKAKALLKQDSGKGLSAAPCSSKKVKLENGGAAAAAGSDAEALPTTADQDAQLWQNICAGQWPFQQMYEELTEQVLSPLWEVSSQLQFSWAAYIACREGPGGRHQSSGPAKLAQLLGVPLPADPWSIRDSHELQGPTAQPGTLHVYASLG